MATPITSDASSATERSCAVCGGQDAGTGVARRDGPPAWACKACGPERARFAVAKDAAFTAIEHAALEEAEIAAGAYLAEAGTTDLTELSDVHRRAFTTTLIRTFQAAVRHKVDAALSAEANDASQA